MISINSENISQNMQQEEFVRMILLISIGFIFLTILLICFMYVHNLRKKIQQKTANRVTKIFEDLLIQFINLDDKDVDAKHQITLKINRFLWNNDFKKLLKHNISSLNKLFQGEMKEKVEHLYKCLGLYHETLENLNSNNWAKKVAALNELREMNIEESRDIIKKLVLDNNQRVSIVAMQTLMNLDNNPFKFLHDHKEPLTKAQMLFISKKASIMKATEHSEILTLLKNEEPTQILLALHMCEILNLKQGVPQIIEFLNHKNIDIKIQAFIALANLNGDAYINSLMQFCKTNSIETLVQLKKVYNSRFVRLPFKLNELISESIKTKEYEAQHRPLFQSVFN